MMQDLNGDLEIRVLPTFVLTENKSVKYEEDRKQNSYLQRSVLQKVEVHSSAQAV